MTIYKANKYYTTMNYDTFIVLGTDEEVLRKAHELQMKCIADNCDENCNAVGQFLTENNLIYLDDVSSPLEIGSLEDELEVAIDSNGNAYVYKKLVEYVDRF